MALEPRSLPTKSDQPLYMSPSHLELIRDMTRPEDPSALADRAQLEELKRRREASRRLVADWPDTYAGRHKARLEGAEEEKRMHMEHAAFKDCATEQEREQRDNKLMNRIWRQLYERTDRVRRLNAAVQLAEVLKERESQRQAKWKKDHAFDSVDSDYLQGMLRSAAAHQGELDAASARVKSDRARNADNWARQKAEASGRRRQEELEKFRLGHVIRDEALRYEEAARKEKAEARDRKLEFRRVLDEEVETKRRLQRAQAELAQADERRAEVFRDAKRQMALVRKENSREDERVREEKAAKMREHLIMSTAKTRFAEEENLKKAIREKEAQLRQQESLKADRREEAQESIQRFYEAKLRSKEDERKEEFRRKFREGKELEELAEQMYGVEDAKEAAWVAGEKEAQHVQLHQVAEKNRKAKERDLEDMKDYMRHMRELHAEEELFQQYAQLKLEECERKGLDAHPVKMAAQPGVECGKGPLFADRADVRPKYLGAVQDPDELSVLKRRGPVLDTKSRLGFTY